MADNPFAEDPNFYIDRLKTGRNKGEFDGCVHNVLTALEFDPEWSGVIALDEFRQEMVKLKEPPYLKDKNDFEVCEWSEIDDIRTAAWLTDKRKILTTPNVVAQAVKAVAFENKFHAVRDWLDKLEWDGTSRLGELLTAYFGVSDRDDPDLCHYHWLVSRMFMIAAVARMYTPGCKVDNVLILEGPEGIRKSSGIKALLFDEEFFSDTPFRLGDKEGYQTLRGKWIIELAELTSFLAARTGEQRAFFSSTTDNFRSSYGKKNQNYPRQCIFIGTTNDYEYLMDSNNRRYWPAYSTGVDVEKIIEDRDQLWAEAKHLFENNEQWWPDKKDLHLFEKQQQARAADDLYKLKIETWLHNKGKNETAGKDYILTMDSLVSHVLQIPTDKQHGNAITIKVGKIMSELGYKRVQATTQKQRELCRYHYVLRKD